MSELKYNERKLQVLEAMADGEEVRASELMEYLGDISLEATKKYLTRYYWWALLSRKRGLYSITQKGIERLEYLQSLTQE